ncbi:hypothetical protein V2I01_36345 [Micromonospora sp. BRA006-A]|nr:hypothetical protein [Micromonospora sp. BRA006-A]
MNEANIAIWRLIVRGSGNTAYQLAFNSLVAGTFAVGDVPRTPARPNCSTWPGTAVSPRRSPPVRRGGGPARPGTADRAGHHPTTPTPGREARA